MAFREKYSYKTKGEQNMKKKQKEYGAAKTQPISQPDRRGRDTNLAIPNDENVERAREFVIENKK